jgi:K+-transporting ATPase KdpF subunit
MDHPEYVVGGIIAGLVTIYLVIALLFPERF